MRVMDALASQMEALKERVEMAEAHIKELQGGCSCNTWRAHTHGPKGEILGLTESFKDMHQ